MSRAKEIEKKWTDYAVEHLVGRKIKAARYLTNKEVKAQGWSHKAVVIELDDGTLLFPSRDDEGNGPGALFGQAPEPSGEFLCFPVIYR